MCLPRTHVALILSLALMIPALAQQVDTSAAQGSPPALTLLRQSLAALTGGLFLRDVTLSGTARRIAGSDDEAGTVVIKALAGTGARIDLSLPSGPRTEIRNTSSLPVAGSWSGPDRLTHMMFSHNLLTDPGWSPVFTLGALLSSPNVVITYVGLESHDGRAVLHISAAQQFATITGDLSILLQHLSQTEVFLDATTLLPAAIAFNIHPDDKANVDIPTEIDYSDYQTVDGAQIPFRVQKFINNTSVLELQFTSAILNSGLSSSTFAVEGGL